MIGLDFSVVNSVIGGTFVVAISFVFFDSQKKDNLGNWFGNDRNDGNEVTFSDELFSFVSLISGSQKNENSVTDFVCGNTGDEMNFVGGVIRRVTTCCMGL